MKRVISLLCIVGLVVWCTVGPAFAETKPAEKPKVDKTAKPKVEKKVEKKDEIATVTLLQMKGSVEVRPSAKQPWAKAKTGMKLGSNWEISTGLRGKAVLKFADNSTVVVQRLTEMKISDFSKTKSTVKTRIRMKYGAVRVHVKKGTARNDFQVACPTATASVKGTKINQIQYFSRA